MKRFLPVVAALLGCAAAWSSEPVVFTDLHTIASLTNQDVASKPQVAIEATVIYFNHDTQNMDVQENNEAIFVRAVTDSKIVPGDRVQIRGTLQPSFLPYVVSNSVTVLRHGTLPEPVTATYDDLVHTKLNCRYVRVRGVVRTADTISSPVAPAGLLSILMDGGYVDIELDTQDGLALRNLLDTEIEVIGTAGRKFDGKMQQTGAKVKLSSPTDIKVLRRAVASPWTLPVTPLNQVIMGTHIHDISQRLRVHGTITYYQPGSAVVLQDGDRSLWVSTLTREPMQIGDVAEATGFADTHGGLLALAHAEVLDSHTQAPVTPKNATWRQLSFWGRSVLGGMDYDLVSTQGRVVTAVRLAAQDEYVISADGRLFTAIYHHPPAPATPPPMLQVPPGSTIQVTGICVALDANPYNNEEPFNILMRSFNDIQVLAKPSLLNVRNLTMVVIFLLALVVIAGSRSWLVERRVRLLHAELAYLERRRSHILEDINSSRPLAEIIEQITELVSFRLRGAPCWCEIADGAKLGNCPEKPETLRIVPREIPARSGPPLGKVYAAFDRHTRPGAVEAEALSIATELLTLAIETRRLYSDLLHRSEFDLLTDIQNRFSLEKHMAALIQSARETASIFGLVYIDLNGFKQVNDLYGHQIGDFYLQEVALRMKRQLRPGDMLARLGGDEFAVLVPEVRNRTEVEEIAQRLEHCFDEPFIAENCTVHGSASVGIALYPIDAKSEDSLLRAADAAMYERKHASAKVASLY